MADPRGSANVKYNATSEDKFDKRWIKVWFAHEKMSEAYWLTWLNMYIFEIMYA